MFVRISRIRGRRGLTGLRDVYYDAITGQPIDPTANGGWVVPTDIAPPWNLPGDNIPSTPFPSGILQFPTPLPNVSGGTLLAAAKLPGAPAVVQRAAAQYASQNPISSWFSGQTVPGLPNYLLAAGAGIVVLAIAGKGKR